MFKIPEDIFKIAVIDMFKIPEDMFKIPEDMFKIPEDMYKIPEDMFDARVLEL